VHCVQVRVEKGGEIGRDVPSSFLLRQYYEYFIFALIFKFE
jgi:hypothetical protein